MSDKQEMRAAFEAWARDRDYFLGVDANGKFQSGPTIRAWSTWQGAWSCRKAVLDRTKPAAFDRAIVVIANDHESERGSEKRKRFYEALHALAELRAALNPDSAGDVG